VIRVSNWVLNLAYWACAQKSKFLLEGFEAEFFDDGLVKTSRAICSTFLRAG